MHKKTQEKKNLETGDTPNRQIISSSKNLEKKGSKLESGKISNLVVTDPLVKN